MNSTPLSRVFTVIVTLIIFIVILYLAYITTKSLGKRYSIFNTQEKNIKILDYLKIGNDKTLMIVKVGGKALLIGVSKEHMEYICDVDEENLEFKKDEK